MNSIPDAANPVALNVEPADLDDALLTCGRGVPVLAGVMARRFATVADGAAQVRRLTAGGVAVSVGLGDGAADQWQHALDIALATAPVHLNQVFPAAALSQRALHDAGAPTVVNALVSPARPGFVVVTTGPLSRRQPGEIAVESALDMLCEVGIQSVKLFPVRGLERLADTVRVAVAAAEPEMLLEPTGGIEPDHLLRLLEPLLATGCRVVPHLYGSVKDTEGRLDASKLDLALDAVARVLGR